MTSALKCRRCPGTWDDVGLRIEHFAWCKRSRMKPDGSRREGYPLVPSAARQLIVALVLGPSFVAKPHRTSKPQAALAV
jgi:hypothetical protein